MTTRPKIGTSLCSFLEGENAQPWTDIEDFYRVLNDSNAAFGPLASLARALAHSEFSRAGLCGVTSMHDLCIGPSRSLLQNPHLRLSFDFESCAFWLTYVDGSKEPWARQASPDDVLEVVSRFLTQRARWFAAPVAQGGGGGTQGGA